MIRVGTITSGFVLIASGVIMICSLFLSWEVLQWMIVLSPLVLIVLGLEMLFFSVYKTKNPNVQIKYDFASIMIMFLLIGCSLVAFAAGVLVDESFQQLLREIANLHLYL